MIRPRLVWKSIDEVLSRDEPVEIWCPKQKKWLAGLAPIFRWECGCKRNAEVVSVITSVKSRQIDFVNCLISLGQVKQPSKGFSIEHVVHDADTNTSRKNSIELYASHHTLYHNSQDSGLYNGFNLGLALSSGQFIAYLNSDDFYQENFIQEALKTLMSTSSGWVFGDTYWHTKDGDQLYEGKVDYFLKPYFNYSRFHHNSVLARREIFQTIGVFPEILGRKKVIYCADYAWFLQAQRQGFFGVYNPEIKGHMNEGGASSDSQAVIAKEAMKIARDIFPEFYFRITLIWWGRIYYNSVLLRYLTKKFPSISSVSRKIYRLYFRVTS